MFGTDFYVGVGQNNVPCGPIVGASTSETGKQVDQFLKKSLSSDVPGKLQAETIPQTASLMSSNRVLMDPSFQPSNWLIENHKKDDAHTALPAATLSRRTRFNVVPHHTHVISHVKPGQSSTVISQVETLLKRVQVSRGCLESNIEVIERSKRDQDSYNAMDAMLINGDTAEKKKLRQLVDTYISLIDSQNKEELFHHQRQMSEIPHSPPVKLISEKIHKLKTPVKDLAKPGRPPKKKVMARIDTGLRKPKDDEDGDKTKREIGALSSKEKREKKESKPHLHDRKKQPLKSFKPPEKYRDSRYMSQVYHKNLFFQGQRSTLQAAPYLRLANPSPETKRVKFSQSKDVNTRGSQTRRGVMEPDMHEQLSYPVDKLLHLVEDSEREFYQKYLAEKHRYPDTAIPLGSPRISSERREPLEIFNQQQQKNVAVINIVSQKPQLEIKHLPPVDIDTEVSSILEDEVISSFSPPPPPPPPPDMSRSDEDEVPAASGFVTFQGHHNYESQYNGPSFPPQVPVSQPQPRSDDVPAHLQRRDLLEQRAVEWIEQELMAKMISEFHHRLSSNTENRPDSLEQSLTDSSHTVNAIGSGGVQLFVDAGQPVNSDLVSSLIREVLEEDITKMLGHVRENPLRDRSQQILEQHLQDQHEEVSPHREILTPEITPVHSPIDSPPPVGDGWKLETPEPSYSEVSQEAESEVTPDHEDVDNLVSTPASPMVTPPPTPPPVSAFSSEPGHIDTPPPSSQDTPPLMRGDPDIVGTPSLTVDVTPPCSPIPMEETSRISSIPPLEGETTPPPTPSIKTKETTTPPSSESTTSCTSPEITETSGKEISAGEWLISQQSEGQVPKLLLEGVKPDQKGTEVSQTTSSDTLLETEELEADTVQDSLEEGEIRAGTNRQNIGDPVVAILTRLNQLSNKTGKGVVGGDPSSPGEISEGQRPLLAPNVVSAIEDNIGFAVDGSDPQSPGEVKIETGEAIEPGEAPRELTKSNQLEKSALRLSDLNSGNSSSKEEKEDVEDPTLVSPGDGAGEEVRQGVKIIAPRVIHVGSKRPPDQKDKEETGEGTPQNVRGTRNRGAPDFDPYDSHATLEGNLRTRTLTPDAINMEALLQSGYLSQTFSQSDAGGQPLVTESKGTIGGGGGTLQLTEGMMGTTFGTTMTEDSLEVGTTKPKLSVQKPKAVSITLPSTDRGEEKIDWSGSESEGNPPGHETISDVSEISACDPNQD